MVWTIRKRLIVIMLMLFMGVVALVTVFWLPRVADLIVDRAKVDAQSQLELLGDGLLDHLVRRELAQVHSLINAAKERSDTWQGVWLYLEDNTQIYPMGAPDFPTVLDDGDVLVSRTVEFHGEVVGRITAHVDLSTEISQLWQELRELLWYFSTIFFVGVVAITFLVDRLIVQRIHVLATAAEELSRGNFNAELPPDDGDEIGQLAASFDVMRKEVFSNERSLLKARLDAEEAAETKSNFLATMSHEIRTPLNGVIPVAELLRETRLTPVQEAYVKTIQHSAEALKSIIDDVLDISKLEAGQMVLQAEPFNMKSLGESVVAMVRPRADRRGLKLMLTLDPTVEGDFVGDIARIRQILVNLVGNAVKYTTEGSVFFEICDGGEIGGRKQVMFRIVDTGIGIAKQHQAMIFERFRQVDNYSRGRKFEGTGLGLSICKSLVDNMQGEIGVESVLGVGSTFWFRIPLEPAAKTHDDLLMIEQIMPKQPANAQMKILVADDNKVNLEVAQALLHNLGYACETATSGQGALDLYAEHKFDLILMDLQMPEVDGLMAARGIRDMEGPDDHAIIVGVSASTFEKDRIASKEAGMDDFLAKPLTRRTLSDLMGKVEAMLAQNAASD